MTNSVVSIAVPGAAVHAPTPDVGSPAGAPLPEFLAGPENRLACVAIATLLDGDAENFNPVVFSGPSGVGKSHLAWGLVAAWKARFGPKAAIYVPAVDFGRELNDAIEAHAVDDFRQRYRQASLLAIDDVDRLGAKDAAQRELMYTFDAVLENGGRMILTSSLPPEQLTGLLPGLTSRLVSGLSVPLALPSAETRLTALTRMAQTRQIPLSEPAAQVLAEGFRGPLSGLWGAIMELDLAARANGGTITAEQARRYLAGRTRPNQPTLRDIAAMTARHFSLRVADLRSPSRRRAVVTARDVAMYLARSLTDNSLQQIGDYFHGRDHTTVSHGCGKTEKLVETDLAIREAVRQLRDQLERARAPRSRETCSGKKC